MKVSLYIPTFNAAESIQTCLELVLRQTHPLKEIVVVDDCSTDNTVEIISRYPVRLIRHTNNRGLGCARNTAIRNINTEFVASLDADCIPEPDWLVQLMKKFNSPGIAGAGGKLLEISSTVCDMWRSVHMRQYWGKEQTSPPFLYGSNTVFHKKALLKVGLYNEDFKNNYEDVDICSRLKKAGYTLVYEPKAIAHHLKCDNIYSILNNYWRWNLGYYQKEKYYSSQESFVHKLKDNIGLANRYIEEDIASKRYQLLYLDFLLALHHSLKDFEYFIHQNNGAYPNYASLSFWLSLLDLSFFYHFDAAKKNLSTLMPKENIFLQNFFTLNLILGKFIQERFKSSKFKRILYKHLLLSVYKMNDNYLLGKLLNLVELHQDWSQFCKKGHSNLNTSFLGNLSVNFKKWLDCLRFNFPNIIQMIEESSEKTDKLSIFKKEGCDHENR